MSAVKSVAAKTSRRKILSSASPFIIIDDGQTRGFIAPASELSKKQLLELVTAFKSEEKEIWEDDPTFRAEHAKGFKSKGRVSAVAIEKRLGFLPAGHGEKAKV